MEIYSFKWNVYLFLNQLKTITRISPVAATIECEEFPSVSFLIYPIARRAV